MLVVATTIADSLRSKITVMVYGNAGKGIQHMVDPQGKKSTRHWAIVIIALRQSDMCNALPMGYDIDSKPDVTSQHLP